MISILYAILLVVLPILVFPVGSYSLETSKVLIAEAAIWILLLYRFVRSNYSITPGLIQKYLPYVILLGLIFFHTLNTPNASDIWGNPMRLQGVFLYVTLIVFSMVSGSFRFTIDSRFVTGILGILFFSAFMVKSTETTRAVGLLGESNALAAAAVGLWPFCAPFYRNIRKTELLFIVLSMLFSWGIVLLSGSRSGLLALGLEVLLYMVIQFKKTYVKQVIYFTVGLYALMHMFVFVDVLSAVEQRSEIWHVAVQAIQSHPIVGSGIGSIERSMQVASWDISSPVRFLYVDSAHNMFMDFGIQLGFIGVVCLFSLIYLSLRYFYKHSEWMKFVQLVGISIVSSFNPLSIVSLVLFWFLLGQRNENNSRL